MVPLGSHKTGNILLGVVYVPPENSKYSSIEIFNEIENDLLLLEKSHTGGICLVGDFNSRCNNMSDLPSDRECKYNSITDNCTLYCSNIPERISWDKGSNNYGKRLIELCLCQNVCFLNGRSGTDAGIGACTCKGSSTVDYVITSYHLYQSITDFKILDFDPLMSDVHNQIQFCIDVPNDKKVEQTFNQSPEGIRKHCRPRWDDTKVKEFVSTISELAVCDISSKLDILMSSNDVTLADITSIVDKINSQFNHAAIQVGNIKANHKRVVQQRESRKNIQRPWFNKICEEKRNMFFKTKNEYKLQPTEENRESMKNSSRAYKAQVMKEKRIYDEQLCNRLRGLK
jgi:hypothetical protein